MGKRNDFGLEKAMSSWFPLGNFQSDKRGDIYWRSRRNQAEWLKRKGYLTVQR